MWHLIVMHISKFSSILFSKHQIGQPKPRRNVYVHCSKTTDCKYPAWGFDMAILMFNILLQSSGCWYFSDVLHLRWNITNPTQPKVPVRFTGGWAVHWMVTYTVIKQGSRPVLQVWIRNDRRIAAEPFQCINALAWTRNQGANCLMWISLPLITN